MLSPGHNQICTVELNSVFKLQTKLLERNSLKQSFDLLPNELSRMREVKESRYDIKKKEDLMMRTKFPFLLRITSLNGENQTSYKYYDQI